MDREALMALLGIVLPALTLLAEALVAVRVWRSSRRPGAATLAWACCAGVVPVAAGLVIALLGKYLGRFRGVAALCAAGLLAFCLALARERFAERLFGGGEAVGDGAAPMRRRVALRSAVCLALAALLAALALEISWNWEIELLQPVYLLVSYAFVALAMVGLYFAFGRRGVAAAVLAAALLVLGIAQFFVTWFKSDVILPRDFFAVGTALEVAGQYNYRFYALNYYGFALTGLAIAVLAQLMRPARAGQPAAPARRTRGLVANAACAVACFGIIAGVVRFVSFSEVLGISTEYWGPSAVEQFSIHGYVASFVASLQDIPIRRPQGYTDAAAEELVASYAAEFEEDAAAAKKYAAAQAQAAKQLPNIVVVMNETFADLSVFEQLHAGYDGPTYVTENDAWIARGAAAVSVLGGGTANTEFEFLTGISMSAVGSGKYPYAMYDLSEAPSLAKQLASLGYTTVATHPNPAKAWDRGSAYEALGFDRFITKDDYPEDAEWLHNGPTDKETYKKVLEVLRESNEPAFVFDVTLQNHSGYLNNDIPEELLGNYHPADFDDSSVNAELNEFLGCIKASEQDIEWLVDELAKFKEPTLLLFFGDHHPSFSYRYNDWVFGASEADWTAGETQLTHEERIHNTVYFAWANYDAVGEWSAEAVDDSSPNYFAAQLCALAGLPLTSAQEAQLAARASIPAYNDPGYEGADGVWYADDVASGYAQVRADLTFMDYLAMRSFR